MSSVTVKFNLLPPKADDITEEWLQRYEINFHDINRFRYFQFGGDSTPKGKVEELKLWHGEIVNALKDSWEEFLSSENSANPKHRYINPNNNQLLRDEENICRKCLERKHVNESPEEFMQRVVPLLLIPTKSKNNRSSWVKPAEDNICHKYEIKIGSPEGAERNNFIDKIAQQHFSDKYAQRFQRALGKNFGVHFYFERGSGYNDVNTVNIEGKIYHYKITDPYNKKDDAADCEKEFLRCANVLVNKGVTVEDMVSLVRTKVGTPCHHFSLSSFLFPFSCLPLSESVCICIS